jgi:hypothetical protein
MSHRPLPHERAYDSLGKEQSHEPGDLDRRHLIVRSCGSKYGVPSARTTEQVLCIPHNSLWVLPENSCEHLDSVDRRSG